MRVYGQLITELADAEIDRWPIERPFALRPSMQRITLRTILRAVFGIERDERRLAPCSALVRYANQGLRPGCC